MDVILYSKISKANERIDSLENILNPVVPLVWTDYGSSSYPTGWRTGWYNSETGQSAGSVQLMRLYKLVDGIDNYAIRVTPPPGKYAVITEYSDKPAGADNYVNGLMGEVNQTISYNTVTGRYYGISIGYWDESSESDITPQYTATIHGEYSGSLVSQSFGQNKDVTISQKAITENVYNPLNKLIDNTKKSGRFLERGVSIENGEEHELAVGQFVRKNWSVAFCGSVSSFTSMIIGLNYKAGSTAALAEYPRGLIVEITGAKVTVTKRVRVNGVIQYETVLDESHGLTVGSYIQCILKGTDTNAGLIHLNCDGQVYDGNITDVEPLYYYCPFVEATNCTISNADISFSCEDFDKDILIIGDSYTRCKNNMWPYYLHEAGYDANCCINGHGGAKSFSEGYTALDHLLEMMHPKYVLWCLGMNDGSDTDEDTPNENWIIGRDWMLQSCQSNGCIPVFTTIPNVTDGNDVVLHDGKNKWIRNSGYQYIDFALAVGADSTGNWRTGLRENATGFHPSALGAKVLFMQAITDFPQLTITK